MHLLAFLILVGVTTMYYLLPMIHPPPLYQPVNHSYHLKISEAFKNKPIPSTVNRARRCADHCILREYMEFMI